MKRSIEQRLTQSTSLAGVGLLVLLGGSVYLGVRAALVEQLDRALFEEARLIAGMVEVGTAGFELDFADLDREDLPRAGQPSFIQLWLPNVTVLYKSRGLGTHDLPLELPGSRKPVYQWDDHASWGRLRTVQLAFRPLSEISGSDDADSDRKQTDADDEEAVSEMDADPSGSSADGSGRPPRLVLSLARSGNSVAAVLSRLGLLLGVAGVLLGGAAAALSRTLTRAGLRPLREFASRIASLDERKLSSRLDTASSPTEVAPVGERLNEFLDRLQQSFERERAFSADIAHELRTPLTGLRSTVDVALRRQREPEQYRLSLKEVQDAAIRLQSLVDRLLWLVRLDAESVELEVQPVELRSLLQQTWIPLEPGALKRRLQVEWHVPDEVEVVSDPMLVQIALRNVLENAVAYADEGGRVEVRVERRGDSAVVDVSNTGSLVRQEDVPILLRRFVRGDEARTPLGAKCGLGLALVDKIAEALGHLTEIRTQPGGSFEVSLSIPAG